MERAPVGIVTLSGDTNYGNRLQNFALQEAILSLGVPVVESIDGLPRHERSGAKARRLLSTGYGRRRELLARAVGSGDRVQDLHVTPPARRAAIQRFSDRYIQAAPASFTTDGSTSDLTGRYSSFVVGSDQVWNPAFTHGNMEWFLDFARPQQRIAYAASIGVPDIPSYLRGRFRKGFRLIRALSVREHRASQTVQDLTGRIPPVVLDPTMLLPVPRWRSLAARPEGLDRDGYIATFTLSAGDTTAGSRPEFPALDSYSRRRGLPVVDLYSPDNNELAALGPEGFLGAIEGAALLVTDSFHAAVFATLFHRPFLLVPRGAMNSRFETLLRHTGLTGRLLAETTHLEHSIDVDWADVDDRLEATRSRSLDFLSEALQQSQP
jgi:hypothetical protein